jgi:hypothetical protein
MLRIIGCVAGLKILSGVCHYRGARHPGATAYAALQSQCSPLDGMSLARPYQRELGA